MGTSGASPQEICRWRTIKVPAKTVQLGAKQVFMRDIGVLLYFLASLGILVISLISPNSLDKSSDCPHSEPVRLAGTLFWPWACFNTFWWWCCIGRPLIAEVPWDDVNRQQTGASTGPSAGTIGVA